jgi:hypothetical protein
VHSWATDEKINKNQCEMTEFRPSNQIPNKLLGHTTRHLPFAALQSQSKAVKDRHYSYAPDQRFGANNMGFLSMSSGMALGIMSWFRLKKNKASQINDVVLDEKLIR